VHHRRAHLAVRTDPNPHQARARHPSLVAGTRRPVAALAPRSEERSRGWKSVVVGEPFVLLFALWEFFGFDISGPSNRDFALFLATGGQEFFSGVWSWYAVVIVQLIFNSVLGEDLHSSGDSCCRECGASLGEAISSPTGCCSPSTICTSRGLYPPPWLTSSSPPIPRGGGRARG
jgi:hypothetical protein